MYDDFDTAVFLARTSKAFEKFHWYFKNEAILLSSLVLLLKRFHDQQRLTDDILTPDDFSFEKLIEPYEINPDSIMQEIRKIDELNIFPIQLSDWFKFYVDVSELEPSHVWSICFELSSLDLSDENLKKWQTDFASVFDHWIGNLFQHRASLSGTPKVNVTSLMFFCSRIPPKDKILMYFPHSGFGNISAFYSDIWSKHCDLEPYIQEQNIEASSIAALRLISRGIANFALDQSNPITNPVVFDGSLFKFDRVIASIPFGVTTPANLNEMPFPKRFKFGGSGKTIEMAAIQNGLAHLKDDGIATFIVPLGILRRSGNEKEAREALTKEDLLDAVILLPDGSLEGTATQAAILIFKKNKPKERSGRVLFIDSRQIMEDGWQSLNRFVVELYLTFQDNDHKSRVVDLKTLEENDFNWLPTNYVDDSYEANELRGLLESHDKYELRTLADSELVKEIKKLRSEKDIKDNQNCIYMPSISNMQPIADIRNRLTTSDTKIDRYYQVELNPDYILAGYAEHFFKSDLGKALFRKTGEGATIPHVNLERLRKCQIATPPVSTQEHILETTHKFDKLSHLIEGFKDELALNPESSLQMSDKLDDMIASVTKLSDEEEILGLIRAGENKEIEFKETFEYNERIEGNRDKKLVHSSIKTIAAFINSGGGNLLVGVADNREVVGINRDIKMNKGTHDSFLLHFKNFIEKRIGQEYYPVIQQRITMVKGKPILRVECQSAKEFGLDAVFVDNEDCFVRTNPATDKLTGRELDLFLRSFRAANP